MNSEESQGSGVSASGSGPGSGPDAGSPPTPTPSLSDAGRDARTPVANGVLSTFCWSVTAILLSFLCLTQLGVLLDFCIHSDISPFLAPAALFLALVVGAWLAQREGLRGAMLLAPPVAALAIVALAMLLAASFYDMAWDGLWYHQAAVYQMAHGWNPLRDPMHEFHQRNLQDWLRHYPKGPWQVALALFETTHDIEWAKVMPSLAPAAAFFAVFAASIDFGMRRRVAVVVAALVALNPVVTCQSVSYLVDGILVSFMACFVAAQMRQFRRPSLLVLAVVMESAILCIDTKLSGLAYYCIFCAAGGLYVLFKRRDRLARYAIVQFASILLGVLAFGYNPYVTNFVHRGNPLYPWLGSAAWPSLAQRGLDGIERYETPKNLLEHNRVVRLAYGIFGRPGNQPYIDGRNASFMWPFDVRWKDFQIFYFQDLRISGFGPLFGGSFLIATCLLLAAMIRPGIPREIPILLLGAIVASLLISRCSWWARYCPQLWWMPIVAVVAGLAIPGWRGGRWLSWFLATLLLANAVLVTVAHFQWEVAATRKATEEMAMLKQKRSVDVALNYFAEPFGERLRAAGVKFRTVRRLTGPDVMELTCISTGYPGAVRARVPEQ